MVRTDRYFTRLSVSPDGAWLLFDYAGTLYELPSDGSTGPVEVAGVRRSEGEFAIDGAYDPSGESVVFALRRTVAADDLPVTEWDIYLLDRATGLRTRVTSTPEPERYPAFTPDGRDLIFTRGHRYVEMGLKTPAGWRDWNYHLLDMGANSESRISALELPGEEEALPLPGNGQFILSARWPIGNAQLHWEILLLEPKRDPPVTQLTRPNFAEGQEDDWLCSYVSKRPAPVGSTGYRIVFLSYRGPYGCESRLPEVWVMGSGGEEPRQLAKLPLYAFHMAASVDGRWAYVLGQAGKGMEVWRVDLESGETILISRLAGKR